MSSVGTNRFTIGTKYELGTIKRETEMIQLMDRFQEEAGRNIE